MEKNRRDQAHEPLSAQTAFVVHLTAVGPDDGAEALMGRVEHVFSGHSLRFTSVRELVTFMRRAASGQNLGGLALKRARTIARYVLLAITLHAGTAQGAEIRPVATALHFLSPLGTNVRAVLDTSLTRYLKV